ncbi:MAG: M48 family metalloprotease [Candidatus Micrarchaeota archaeon]|nr:M48 family metalloprotease [Candidatus Micrarchaeota archaeon]
MAGTDVGFNPGWGMRIRVLLTSVLVFGLVAAVMGLLLNYLGFGGSGSILMWILVSFVMIGAQWYFGPAIIKWATGAKTLSREAAPELFEIVQRLTQKARLPMPKLYMVNNPTPNAFAFGRTQSDSNIAVHSGLLSVLSKDEVEGVLAHEIGHINNRDVAVMTLASVIPVMLYYGFLIFGSDREGRSSIMTILGAFVAQFIGQLMVMWLSRQREYFADEFSARLTGNPVPLMSALAKITYGQAAGAAKQGTGSMASALYIAEPSGSKMSIAEIASAIRSGNEEELASAIEKEKKGGAMEFLMTHPLTSKRLERLMRIKKGLAA